tara:strand:+ start:681 stop:1073 length:393 start_codon:yes stop_codon:yes gene_type:complete
MENVENFKIFIFLSFIVILLLWKFWKDGEFRRLIDVKLDEIINNKNNLIKELEALSLEINDNTKKLESLASYLKRLDQNASRLADDIRGEQAMTKAIEMARTGQDHLDIIKATGLSNEEVEAIIHSHKDN